MSSFGQYLDSVSLPIVQKVLVGLGFGTITYVGLQTGFDTLKLYLTTSFDGFIPSLASIFFLGGFNTAFGIILSASSMRIAMIAVKRFGLV